MRRLFVVVLVWLPVQYALVGLLGSRYGEPWPAVVMPGFQRVWDTSEQIVLPTVVLEVHFADGARATVPHAALLHDLPRSHHRAFLEAAFRPETLSGRAGTERARHPEAVGWLRARLGTLYPGRRPVRLDARWVEMIYRPGDRAVAPLLDPVDTLVLDLR